MKPDMKNIDDVVHRYLPSAAKEDVESGGARVLQRLETNTNVTAPADRDLLGARQTWWRLTPLRAAAVAAVVLVGIAASWSLVMPNKVYAIVQSVDGRVYRVADGKTQTANVGEKVEVGTGLRTASGAGAVLKLSDGASIQLHEKSDVRLEPMSDGLRIKLNDGSVSVTPAKQPSRNLYVQTKEETVPVVAALFQSVAASQTPEPRVAFDVVSIRTRLGAGGGGGAGARGAGGGGGGLGKCTGNTPKIDPSRYSATNAGIYLLIASAYGISAGSSWDITSRCFRAADRLSGGPDWIDNDTFDIEAVIPDGPQPFTSTSSSVGFVIREPSPRLQKMLQTMLEERFKLVLRRETKEMPVYVLSVAKGGPKLTPWKDGDLANGGQNSSFMLYNSRELPFPPKHTYDRQRVSFFYGAKASTGWLAGALSFFTKRVVLDRTGLAGDYNYQLVFAPLFPPVGGDPGGLPVMSSPSLFTALEEDFGLELKPSTEKVEVFVIERLERPSEN